MRETDYMSGLAKGLKVIEAFSKVSPRLSIADVSRLTGLDRATARRCLLTLSSLGYAEHDGKYFTLTPRVLRFGYSYLSSAPLPVLVQPFLESLSDIIDQSSSSSLLDDLDIVYFARASHHRVMSVNLTVGSRLPAWCSSMGRVLLAGLSEKDRHERLNRSIITKFTHKTRTDIHEIDAEIANVARQGYALIDQELELGLCSVAAPLHNRKGEIVAAINISLPAPQITLEEIKVKYLPQLQITAREISLLLN